MAIPFSNTHHRIPRGFGNLLEGLTREVLREQPTDIPDFAAKYFAELLKKREETNFDPAEWGARLDDRFYNIPFYTEQKTGTRDLSMGRKQINEVTLASKLYVDVPSDTEELTPAPDAAVIEDTHTVDDEDTEKNQLMYTDVSAGTTNVDLSPTERDMVVTGIVERDQGNLQLTTGSAKPKIDGEINIDNLQRGRTAEKQDAEQYPDEGQETQLEEANIETEMLHDFTVEEPEEQDTSSTQRDELSDSGDIKIILEETELHSETSQKQDDDFVEEKVYIVEEELAESGQEDLSISVYLQEDENDITAISQAEEQEESDFMEGDPVTNEEESID